MYIRLKKKIINLKVNNNNFFYLYYEKEDMTARNSGRLGGYKMRKRVEGHGEQGEDRNDMKEVIMATICDIANTSTKKGE